MRAVPRKPLHVISDQSVPQPLVLPRICKRPACPNQLPVGDRQGRKPSFCSEDCRRRYAGEQRQAVSAYRDARRLAEQYEVPLDEEADSLGSASVGVLLPSETADHALSADRSASRDGLALDRLVRALLAVELLAERDAVDTKDLLEEIRKARQSALRLSIGAP